MKPATRAFLNRQRIRTIHEDTPPTGLQTLADHLPKAAIRAARRELLAAELFPNNGCAWSPDGEHDLYTSKIAAAKDGTVFVTTKCTWCEISESTEQ